MGLESKGFALYLLQPSTPAAMKRLPLFILQLIHRGCQPTPRQLSGQCGTNPLIGLLKSFLERDGNQAQSLFPTFEPLRFVRSMSLKRRRWAVSVACADRTNPGLMVAHLSSGSDNASLLIKQQQIAVATHEFQNQHPLNELSRSGRELKFHHALEPFLVELHKG